MSDRPHTSEAMPGRPCRHGVESPNACELCPPLDSEPVPLAWGITIKQLRVLAAMARRAPGWTPVERETLASIKGKLGQ